MLLFPHTLGPLLLVKPDFPIFRHCPGIAVLPQVRHRLALRIDVQELFADSAVAAIVKSLILFLAAGPTEPPNRSFLSRSAHFR